MSTLQQHAEQLLENAGLSTPPAHTDPPRDDGPGYKRLTHAQLALVLALRREGKSQVEIAQTLGVTQPSISRALQHFGTDTTDLAVEHAKARAYRRIRRLDAWTERRDKVGLEAAKELNRIAGMGEGSKGPTVQVGIVLHGGADPLAQVQVGQTVSEAEPR